MFVYYNLLDAFLWIHDVFYIYVCKTSWTTLVERSRKCGSENVLLQHHRIHSTCLTDWIKKKQESVWSDGGIFVVFPVFCAIDGKISCVLRSPPIPHKLMTRGRDQELRERILLHFDPRVDCFVGPGWYQMLLQHSRCWLLDVYVGWPLIYPEHGSRTVI